MSEEVKRIRLHRQFGDRLILRSSVAPLFRLVAEAEAPRIVLDFAKVESMSGSFADEYLAARGGSRKRIEEVHVPTSIQRMMDVVSRRRGGAARRTLRDERPARPGRAIVVSG